MIVITALATFCLAAPPGRIEVVDKANGWPVPLVELRTTHNVRLITDNAGIIACDLPELMGKETWFGVHGHGYGVKADGFGYKGVRLTLEPGKTLRVEVTRDIIAKRLGRLTGAGLFAESQKLGADLDQTESSILGCDSVQDAVYRGRHFWLWGDTALARYPLGIFDASAATTELQPIKSFQPPLQIKYDYFRDDKGAARGVAKMPGSGPTWVFGVVTLPDKSGQDRLCGTYMKVKPPLEAYEYGLCDWNDQKRAFDRLRVVWTKSTEAPKQPPMPDGNAVIWQGHVYFGHPLPRLRCPAMFEAWNDPAQWEILKPQDTLISATDKKTVKPHGGSIAWNPWRKRWITVFVESYGKPSFLGELWYAEASAPTGPWGPAVKVLSHDNYSFYNPRLHPEFTPADSPIVLFEGTYTATFADRPPPTPRHDYNQILYRLDLDDPALKPAQGKDVP